MGGHRDGTHLDEARDAIVNEQLQQRRNCICVGSTRQSCKQKVASRIRHEIEEQHSLLQKPHIQILSPRGQQCDSPPSPGMGMERNKGKASEGRMESSKRRRLTSPVHPPCLRARTISRPTRPTPSDLSPSAGKHGPGQAKLHSDLAHPPITSPGV